MNEGSWNQRQMQGNKHKSGPWNLSWVRGEVRARWGDGQGAAGRICEVYPTGVGTGGCRAGGIKWVL